MVDLLLEFLDKNSLETLPVLPPGHSSHLTEDLEPIPASTSVTSLTTDPDAASRDIPLGNKSRGGGGTYEGLVEHKVAANIVIPPEVSIKTEDFGPVPVEPRGELRSFHTQKIIRPTNAYADITFLLYFCSG